MQENGRTHDLPSALLLDEIRPNLEALKQKARKVAQAAEKKNAVERCKVEHPVEELFWPPLERMNTPAAPAARVNLADYIRDDPRAGNQNDDWGFIFNEREYADCDRATQEKLVSHIQASCAEQGKLVLRTTQSRTDRVLASTTNVV